MVAERCDVDGVALTLILPAQLQFKSVAVGFVCNSAAAMGFTRHEIEQIELAVDEALTNVAEHALADTPDAGYTLTCRDTGTGIAVVIDEKGLPFDPEAVPVYDPQRAAVEPEQAGLGLHLMRRMMDQVEFRNLGRDGKQTILTRHLATKRIDNLLAAATGTPALPVPATPTGTWRIREFAPRDALGIARSAYRTYGYTYEPFIYYPEQITAMNARGELLSLVAVNEEDEVVGHIALKFRPDMPALAEVGVGLVIPEYRNRRIFDRLLEQIHARAVARGLTGLFSRPVTSHAVSQKFVEKFLHQVPVGILLGIFPDDVEFKKMTGKVRQKESAIIYYGMLRAAPARTVFLPPGCRDRVLAVFSSLNIPVITGAVDGAAAAGETELHSSTCEVLNVAELRVPVLGVNVLAEIDRVRRELCLRHIDVIYLYLDLEDPLAAAVGEACCRAGFLFAGLLPFAGCGRHTLILQYLNNLAIDYAAIRPFSPVARDLLSYVHSTGAPDGHGDANASAV